MNMQNDQAVIATAQGFEIASEEPAQPITNTDIAVITQQGLGAWLGSLSSTPIIEFNPVLDQLAEQWIYAHLSEVLDIGFAEPPVINARCGQVFLVDVIPQLLTINHVQRRAFDPPVPIIVPSLARPRTANYRRATDSHSRALGSLGATLRNNIFEQYNAWLTQTLRTATEIALGLTGTGEAMAFSTWWGTLRAEVRKLRDQVGITRHS